MILGTINQKIISIDPTPKFKVLLEFDTEVKTQVLYLMICQSQYDNK